MKLKFMKIVNILCILFFWLLSGLFFKFDKVYYNLLKLPAFTLPRNAISITWLVIYIVISISIYKVMRKVNILKCKDYLYVLITNYLSNQLFCFFFFTLMSPFMGFIMTTICLVSSVFLYLETKNINKKASYFLIPYIAFTSFSFILSLTVFIMNF